MARERNRALARTERRLEYGGLIGVAADWDEVVGRARGIPERRTESTGARSFDLLHVAFALKPGCEVFLTADGDQARVARAEGLKVVLVGGE